MWPIAKRVLLFGLVNILVMLSLTLAWSIITRFVDIPPQNAYYSYLILFSVVMGFGGAFISFLMSKMLAKMAMGVQVIPPNTADPRLRDLVNRVHDLARAAKLTKMPEVGIYESPEVNAFATGPSRNNSLVAVSTGLLNRMDRDAVDGVLGHEVAHIANGDMVTMTLLQGIMNAVVIFAARVLAHFILSRGNSNERPNPWVHMGIVMGLEMLFSIFAMVVVNYFSRAREFRADQGGSRFAGREKMLAALRALQGTVGRLEPEQETLATLKISGRPRGALMALFSTHPSLEDRIRRLETGR